MKSIDNSKAQFTPSQIADMLQLNVEHVEYLIASGQLFSLDYYHVTASDLQRYIADNIGGELND